MRFIIPILSLQLHLKLKYLGINITLVTYSIICQALLYKKVLS